MLKCECFKSLTGNVESILLFGLTHKVKTYTDREAAQAESNGLYYYTTATDNEGNIYRLYADSDPCHEKAFTIAFRV